jgi:hypothetical protein
MLNRRIFVTSLALIGLLPKLALTKEKPLITDKKYLKLKHINFYSNKTEVDNAAWEIAEMQDFTYGNVVCDGKHIFVVLSKPVEIEMPEFRTLQISGNIITKTVNNIEWYNNALEQYRKVIGY